MYTGLSRIKKPQINCWITFSTLVCMCNFRNDIFNCWCCKTKIKKRYYNGKCFYISIFVLTRSKKEADHVRSKEQSTRAKPFALQTKKLSLCWKKWKLDKKRKCVKMNELWMEHWFTGRQQNYYLLSDFVISCHPK